MGELAKIHFFTVNKQIMRKNHFTNGKMDFNEQFGFLPSCKKSRHLMIEYSRSFDIKKFLCIKGETYAVKIVIVIKNQYKNRNV